MRRHISSALATLLVATSLVAFSSGSAHAACDWSYYWKLTTRTPELVKRYKGESIYNNTKDPITRTVTTSITRDHRTTKSWEVGGEAGIDWKIVRAKVTGKYGESYVTGVSRSTSIADQMTIRVKHSGWMQANVWNRDVVAAYRRIAPHCGDQLVARAVYRDKYKNTEAKTKQGRVAW
jgi:opacity protein-like surface antigen